MIRRFLLALSFLTILPVPPRWTGYEERIGRIVAWFPLTGAVQGMLSGGAYLLAGRLLNPAVSFVLAVFFHHLLGGFLHLDGLADTADAWAGAKKNPERFREILKDSRVGAVGVCALLGYFLVMHAACSGRTLDPVLFVGFGVAGRLVIAIAACCSRPLYGDGIGAAFLKDAGVTELAVAAVTAVAIVGLAAPGLAMSLAVAAAFGVLYRIVVLRTLGGFSGDLFGAGDCIAEILFVLTATAL